MCLADTAHDSDGLRQFLIDRGTLPVIPNNPTRKRLQPCDAGLHRRRNLVERAVSNVKDWRRVATGYDRLSATYASAIALAIVIG